jgi:tRNA threonylcarbamoyl adenosine modification protein (Sua5/YciO/YrdC/YwlC family)
MSRRFDCSDPEQRAEGIDAAVAAVRMGQLIVLPTDTVYGVGADAFDRNAVTDLLLAKGRGRDMPPPVLVGSVRAGEALIDDLGHYGRDLISEFWPGALTLVCRATPTLNWDLGETKGTVAVRMPLHPVALEILRETGPLAVSSANMSGNPAATTADDAQKQLGSAIEVYLDGGPTEGPMASTIIDLTGDVPRLLRAGVIPIDKIREVTGVIEDQPEPEPEPEPPAAGAEAPAETAEAPAETAEAPAETAEAPAETAEAPAETAGEAGQPAAREQ